MIFSKSAFGGEAGKLLEERWTGISGESISLLTSNANYPNSPVLTQKIAGVEPAINVADRYGRRLRGFLTAPRSGYYKFWICGNDSGQFWLSSDSKPGNKVMIASFSAATGAQVWDKYSSQTSVAIYLNQGEKYYLEVLHKENTGSDFVSIAWQVPYGAREIIPASAVNAYEADENDLDNDGLPDDWELANGLSNDPNTGASGANGASGDPDADGFSNRLEWLRQTFPTTHGTISGGLKREVWLGVTGNQISALTGSVIYQSPNFDDFQAGAESPANLADAYGQRLRGYVTIPATGNYRFYVAGDDNCQLWISENGLPADKRKVAYVEGSAWTETMEWGKYATQKSAVIALTQGQVVYVELLHKESTSTDHLELGWSVGESTPEVIPSQYLQAFAFLTNDKDDDGLPDDWELANGFDVTDNGFLHPEERWNADLDGDGFTNAFEAALGENPRVAQGLKGYWDRSVWKTISGNEVSALTNSAKYYTTPSIKDLVTSLESSSSEGIYCGFRYRTIVTAPVTGTYQVRIAGDDKAEAWISTSASKFGRRRSVSVPDYTSAGAYGRFVVQTGTVDLIAGQPYYMEILLKQATGSSHVSFQWKLPSGSTFSNIDGNLLRSYIPTAEDADDDDLSTDWENSHGFNPNAVQTANFSPQADPDGDHVDNRTECILGSNPFVAASVPGAWVRERWNSMPYYSVLDTVLASLYFGSPASYEALLDSDYRWFEGTYFATRTRGEIIPPVTGKYRFWISGGSSVELSLSPDDKPFAKRRIARIGPEIGISEGISYANGPKYDNFTSQQSAEIELQAGQSYFIELIQQDGHQDEAHVSIAWACNGGERTPIPSSCMATYLPGTADADDDSLPDAWESTVGLDISDNGGTDRQRQGERGDYDADGLTNREEYLAGTNPCNKDSDNDGLSDWEELRNLGTDPSAYSSAGEEVVQTVNILEPVAGSMKWTSFADGMVGERFRGSIEFDLHVPESGLNWVIAIKGKILGQISQTDTMPLIISLDSISLGRKQIQCSLNETSTLRVLTPQLLSGQHRIKIFVDNLVARKSFLLQGVELRRPTGDDLNMDGVPDWLAAFLKQNTWSPPASITTNISPYFLEGGNRYAGNLCILANGSTVDTTSGTSNETWYANAALQSTGITTLTGVFEGGSDIRTTQVNWLPFVVGSSSRIDLRVGDTLKFNFPQEAGDTAVVTYTMQPATWNAQGEASDSKTYTFGNPGTFTLQCVHQNGTTSSTSVVVHQASASSIIVLGTESPRILDLTGVPFDLSLDVVEPVRFSQKAQLSTGGTRLRLESSGEGEFGLLARLADAGPVVAKLPISVTAHAGATSGQYQLIGPSSINGYIVVSVPLVMAGLPDGYKVKVTISRSGVLFENGTTKLTLNSSDFIDGQYMLRFLYPETMQGGYCHTVEILDPQGKVIATY